jgi:aconitate hydratase
MKNSFNTKSTLQANGKGYQYFSLKVLDKQNNVSSLPFSLKVLLENLLRHEDGLNITKDDITAMVNWDPKAEPDTEIAFTPARVLMQDFTGVPAVVDLAAMRDAMNNLGGDPNKINPLSPAELVIDHSVQVDVYGTADALEKNASIEFDRNKERYEFLRWGQQAFSNFMVVPPDTGIVHQVNLEYLARTIFTRDIGNERYAYPDTLVGTDSHTTMINGLGVLGWGVGGIEAEAAMLGQPITMLIPHVVGFKLSGNILEGVTATDLVLTVVEILREKGVVGKFVEFYGDGLDSLPLADRATIANMAPEYGATCGIFPIDQETINYLKLSGRSNEQITIVEEYAKAQGMWRDAQSVEARYSDTLELDMSSVVPSIAGPKRPQDRLALSDAGQEVAKHIKTLQDNRDTPDIPDTSQSGVASIKLEEIDPFQIEDGDIVIAAITSCTNTSNPHVMVGAGILAKKAYEKGLKVKPWVKTSLAPGSLVVRNYLEKAGLLPYLDKLGFNIVGYGCTTCIGNSGPLLPPISNAIRESDLIVSSILSGNRNFEGRVHADVKMNFLASPPLVVAYAIAGTMNIALDKDSLGKDDKGNDVYLKDIWPNQKEISDTISGTINSNMFQDSYDSVFKGDARWAGINVPESELYKWDSNSTYIQNPPYFEGMSKQITPPGSISNARVLALLGDSITTDHISPAGSFKADSPAGKYLIENGVDPLNFNSYGSRRGNHEVMMRGTFANVRLKNILAGGKEGGWTAYQPSGEIMSIFDAAMRYQKENTPLVVLAGKEYGTGSSRDWAAKGTKLLGIRTVIAESFERIHRSNLVGMGVLPLTFMPGESISSLGLDGSERFSIEDFENGAKEVTVRVSSENGDEKSFRTKVRVDTPKEWEYYNNGGILHYVLRQLAT